MTAPRVLHQRPHLSNIALGSNPNSDSRYAERTGHSTDIYEIDYYKNGTWSIACRIDQVGRGTVGWIARQGDGGNPPLCGVIVCTGPAKPYEDYDAEGNRIVEYFVEGRLHGGLWIPGEDIAAAGWPRRRAPWGDDATRQFRNGEHIKDAELRALLDAVPVSTLRLIAQEYCDVTGRLPSWAAMAGVG